MLCSAYATDAADAHVFARVVVIVGTMGTTVIMKKSTELKKVLEPMKVKKVSIKIHVGYASKR